MTQPMAAELYIAACHIHRWVQRPATPALQLASKWSYSLYLTMQAYFAMTSWNTQGRQASQKLSLHQLKCSWLAHIWSIAGDYVCVQMAGSAMVTWCWQLFHEPQWTCHCMWSSLAWNSSEVNVIRLLRNAYAYQGIMLLHQYICDNCRYCTAVYSMQYSI